MNWVHLVYQVQSPDAPNTHDTRGPDTPTPDSPNAYYAPEAPDSFGACYTWCIWHIWCIWFNLLYLKQQFDTNATDLYWFITNLHSSDHFALTSQVEQLPGALLVRIWPFFWAFDGPFSYQQARKPRSYASWNYHPPTHWRGRSVELLA